MLLSFKNELKLKEGEYNTRFFKENTNDIMGYIINNIIN